MPDPILTVKNLKVYFPVKHKRGAFVRAVDDISFTLNRGEILSLVGESGSGKTTAGKAVLRIIAPTAGSVRLNGREIGADCVDEQLGRDTPHRLARALGGFFALSALIGLLFFPVVLARGEAVSWLALISRAPAPGAFEFTGTGIPAFACLLPAFALAALFFSCRVVKKTALAALFSGAGLLAAACLLLSFREGLAMGGGLGAAMASLALSAASLLILPGFYTPSFEKEIRRHAQMIYQDPYQSLNPRQYILDSVAEPLDVNGLAHSAAEREEKSARALEWAGLRPARDYFYRYPHELSGGQRQRVAIAASLILEPDFLVADEPVSMIDASIRLGIIKLMKRMQTEQNIAFLFITHDLSLAWLLSDRIAILYLGRIMEIGTADELVTDCRHPYAKALMEAMPIPGMAREGERKLLKGDIPSAAEEITGCKFHSRCPYATALCAQLTPEFSEVAPGHLVACHHLDAVARGIR